MTVRGADTVRVAIAGGTGFVGRPLAGRFSANDVMLVSRRSGLHVVDDIDPLTGAITGCQVVTQFADINRDGDVLSKRGRPVSGRERRTPKCWTVA